MMQGKGNGSSSHREGGPERPSSYTTPWTCLGMTRTGAGSGLKVAQANRASPFLAEGTGGRLLSAAEMAVSTFASSLSLLAAAAAGAHSGRRI